MYKSDQDKEFVFQTWQYMINALDLALKGEFPAGLMPMQELTTATNAIAQVLENTVGMPEARREVEENNG
jgi:hypothetical protein